VRARAERRAHRGSANLRADCRTHCASANLRAPSDSSADHPADADRVKTGRSGADGCATTDRELACATAGFFSAQRRTAAVQP